MDKKIIAIFLILTILAAGCLDPQTSSKSKDKDSFEDKEKDFENEINEAVADMILYIDSNAAKASESIFEIRKILRDYKVLLGKEINKDKPSKPINELEAKLLLATATDEFLVWLKALNEKINIKYEGQTQINIDQLISDYQEIDPLITEGFETLYDAKTKYPNEFKDLDGPEFLEQISSVYRNQINQAFNNLYDDYYQDYLYKYFEKVNPQDPLVLKVTDKITENYRNENSDMDQMAIGILNFVRQNVKYKYDPEWKSDWVNPPSLTLVRGEGDCDDHSIVLASMMKRAGIMGVELCLVASQGGLNFDHMSVARRTNSGYIFYEATDKENTDVLSQTYTANWTYSCISPEDYLAGGLLPEPTQSSDSTFSESISYSPPEGWVESTEYPNTYSPVGYEETVAIIASTSPNTENQTLEEIVAEVKSSVPEGATINSTEIYETNGTRFAEIIVEGDLLGTGEQSVYSMVVYLQGSNMELRMIIFNKEVYESDENAGTFVDQFYNSITTSPSSTFTSIDVSQNVILPIDPYPYVQMQSQYFDYSLESDNSQIGITYVDDSEVDLEGFVSLLNESYSSEPTISNLQIEDIKLHSINSKLITYIQEDSVEVSQYIVPIKEKELFTLTFFYLVGNDQEKENLQNYLNRIIFQKDNKIYSAKFTADLPDTSIFSFPEVDFYKQNFGEGLVFLGQENIIGYNTIQLPNKPSFTQYLEELNNPNAKKGTLNNKQVVIIAGSNDETTLTKYHLVDNGLVYSIITITSNEETDENQKIQEALNTIKWN